jgi:hypothetical protein
MSAEEGTTVKKAIAVLLSTAVCAGLVGLAHATPVKFTTNAVVGTPGPHRVQYITLYVDGVKKCYTESNGDCTGADLSLAPGLHEAKYVWANCNNPAVCDIYGVVIHYVNVPDQVTRFTVRIPTARVRWYTEYGVGVSLNGVFRVWALGGGTGSTNVMSGCYTASYYKPYPGPAPAWPALGQIPDEDLYGFDGVCVGSSDTYPTPVPDNGTETNPPHVRITIPDYWP